MSDFVICCHQEGALWLWLNFSIWMASGRDSYHTCKVSCRLDNVQWSPPWCECVCVLLAACLCIHTQWRKWTFIFLADCIFQRVFNGFVFRCWAAPSTYFMTSCAPHANNSTSPLSTLQRLPPLTLSAYFFFPHCWRENISWKKNYFLSILLLRMRCQTQHQTECHHEIIVKVVSKCIAFE